MRSGTLTGGGKPTTTFICLHLGAISERDRCLVLADRTVGSSYYQAAGRAAKLCKRWSLAGSEHAGLGMCPVRTTNPPFISSGTAGGKVNTGEWKRGRDGAELEQCFSKQGLHTLTSGGSGSNAVAVKFYPRHFKSKARWHIYLGLLGQKRCLLLK